ncbi:DUF2487 family protein [Paenibacillus sp. NFR01]|uniref:DUF2487 family protein n=1 Tax=Paenibacillus sp. NFR01 TaxID=1566279 RepID=UPI0008D00BD4|nr:DUF2487 family protein [Paenibacillus sp. NFR01]SET51937.1 Protein of unknown function [Paenibacillus sp. NFR01]
MKFSEFDGKKWEENGAYYDTCLIPYTGLSGAETPVQAAEALERLRDFLELAEVPFQGRLVTYPAIQYAEPGNWGYVNGICSKVKSSNFKFVIVMSADAELSVTDLYESDLTLSLRGFPGITQQEISRRIGAEIERMWQK